MIAARMLGYGKMSGCGVAAMSALAEIYDRGGDMSSLQIAELRNLSQPLVAKMLTMLSRAGYVSGTRGPGGGYRLKKDPEQITIYEVVKLFEGHRETSACPFGPGWCGVKEPCPLHETIVGLRERTEEILGGTTFGMFRLPVE